jgi:hypothetical protein
VERLDEELEPEPLELELEPDPDVEVDAEVEGVVGELDVELFEPPPLRSLAAVAEKTPTSATPATAMPRVSRRSRRTPRSRRPTAGSAPGSGPVTSMTVRPPVVCARKTKQSRPEAPVRIA